MGGHIHPNSDVGDNLLWKKDQKNLKKKKISEIINRIIPKRIPFKTLKLWNPINVASRIISRHHWYIVNKTIIKPKIKHFTPKKWNHEPKPVTKIKAPKAPQNGQVGSQLCDELRHLGLILRHPLCTRY